jgi:hypothetical protein
MLGQFYFFIADIVFTAFLLIAFVPEKGGVSSGASAIKLEPVSKTTTPYIYIPKKSEAVFSI